MSILHPVQMVFRPPRPLGGVLAGSKAQTPQSTQSASFPPRPSPHRSLPPGDPTYHPLVHVSPALALQTGLQPFVNIVGCSLSWFQPLLYLGGTGEGHVGAVYCEGPSLIALFSPPEQGPLSPVPSAACPHCPGHLLHILFQMGHVHRLF